MGGFLILQSLLTANYFGRAHLGSITVMTRPAMMIASALSPLIVGLFYDINGNYDYAFMFTAVAWFAAGIVVIMAKPPVKAAGAGERE
jgi:cyanate permease